MHQLGPVDPTSTPSLSAQARPGSHSGRIVALGPAVSQQGSAVSQAPGCRAVASEAPCRGCQPAVSQAQLPCRSARAAPCCTPARIRPLPRPTPARQLAPHARSLRLPRARCAPSAVSWLLSDCVVAVCARRHGRIVVCLATRCLASSSLSCRNTLYCIAMQFQPNQTTVIQYTVLQYSLLSAHLRPPCHDTLSVL